MRVEAPAKVNLVLRLLGCREDGYHEVETLMCPISLSDELEIEVSEGNGIFLTCDDPALPCDESNLAWRAAAAFFRAAGIRRKVTMHLHKRIPSGAGLAGGSSDAAAVLRALNASTGHTLDTSRLRDVAAELGSDVAFFIRPEPSWCRGRGEVLEPADTFPSHDLLLLKPPFPVSTAWAYKAWDASPDKHGPVRGRVVDTDLCNDLEGPVFSKYMQLGVMRAWLASQPRVRCAMMSGSGSTMFAVLDESAPDLESAARERFGSSIWTARVRLLSAGTAGGEA